MGLFPVQQLRLFRLRFSDPSRRFYSSGDKLSGWVELEAPGPLRLSRLRVSAAGCAHVHHRSKSRRSRSQEVEYLKYEEELRLEGELAQGRGGGANTNQSRSVERPSVCSLLCCAPDSDGYFLLQPGNIYSFQFGFELPAAG